MEYETLDFIRDRITELRIQKGVSEYKMSKDLGHNKSYIARISGGKGYPSLTELAAIIDYLGVEPKAFFDDGIKEPIMVHEILQLLREMDPKDIVRIKDLSERFLKDK